MALTTINQLMQTYHEVNTNKVWWADQIHMLESEVSDNKLQLLLPKVPVDSVTLQLPYDEFPLLKSALTTSVNASIGTIQITSGDATKMVPTDVATYNIVLKIGQELLLGTSLSGGTSTITVTRGHGSSTAAIHANASQVDVISVLVVEGAAGIRAPKATTRTYITNYVQTIDEVVQVTGVQEAVAKYGGITSEIQFQLQKSFVMAQARLEKALLYGISAVGSASAAREMSGLWKYIATNKTSDSGDIDAVAIEADIRAIWNNGGTPNVLLCSGKMAQDISKIYENRIVTDINTRIGGNAVTAIVNPLAQNMIAIVPHRMIPNGEYFMGDITKVSMAYIRPFFVEQRAYDADAKKIVVVGDYALLLGLEAVWAYRYGMN